MSAFKDAAENVGAGLRSMWNTMNPEGRALCTGLALGFVAGIVTVGLWVS